MPLSSHPKLYPLSFESIIKEKIWGASNLNKRFNKGTSTAQCGEIWEIASVDNDISQVKEGELKGESLKTLISTYKGELVGESIFQKFDNDFPLLVKFIDANMDLSIQVHPNDEQAKPFNSLGKSEMWYIVDAEPEAKLISGFSQEIDRDGFQKRIEAGNIEEVLHQEAVNKGDIFYTPAGRIHNIGSGLLIAEIQQSSGITYRIHDFDRKNPNGEKRELHIQEALDVLDFEVIEDAKVTYKSSLNEIVQVVKCEHFTVNKIEFDTSIIRNVESLDSFIIYMCIEGHVGLHVDDFHVELKAGDVYLIPATFDAVTLSPQGQSLLLETYID